MQIIKSNVFTNIPEQREDEFVEKLIDQKGIEVERIVSHAHRTPEGKWYNQDQNEFVLVLSGEAIIKFKEQPDIHLGKGDYIIIPPKCEHRVDWTIPTCETIWLTIFY